MFNYHDDYHHFHHFHASDISSAHILLLPLYAWQQQSLREEEDRRHAAGSGAAR